MFLLEDSDAKSESISHFIECANNKNWLKRLLYLADIFNALNVLNLSLQGKDVHKFYVQDKIEAVVRNLQRWARKAEENCFDVFPVLHDFL